MNFKTWMAAGFGFFLLFISTIKSAIALPLYPQPVYPVIGAPNGSGSIVLADINGDGHPDIEVTGVNGTGGYINVLKSSINGSFVSNSPVFPAEYYVKTAIANFNSGGKPELLVVQNKINYKDYSEYAQVEIIPEDASDDFQIKNYETYFQTNLNFQYDDMAVGDVNGDGIPDLVLSDADGSHIGVMLGNGDGTLGPVQTYSGGVAHKFVLADINGDKKLDIVASDESNNLNIMFGDGNGGFAAPTTYALGDSANSIAVADIDKDRHQDIVTDGNGQYCILFNNGDGTLQAPQCTAAPGTVTAITTEDLNGDGFPDLIWTDDNYDELDVSFNQKNGTFGAAKSYPIGQYPVAVSSADLDGDGHPDVVVANAAPNGASVSVLYNLGNGTFSSMLHEPGKIATAVLAVDINGDHIPDIISANTDSMGVQISNGDGTFGPVQDYSTGLYALFLGAGDLNADKYQDVISVSSSNIEIWMNQKNGILSETASYSIPAQPSGIAVADLNDDGRADLVVSAGNSIYTYLSDGSGGLLAPKSFPVSEGFGGVAVAKLNSDNYPDLIIASDYGLDVLLNRGDGTFETAKKYQNCGTLVASADIDGDKKADIICAGAGAGVSILLGNGDGTFSNPMEIRAVQSQMYYAAGDLLALGLADVNQDGLVDIVTVNQDDAVNILQQNSDHTFTLDDSYQAGPNPSDLAIAKLTGSSRPDILVSTSDSSNAIDVLKPTSEKSPTIQSLTLNLNGEQTVNGKLTASDPNGEDVIYSILDQPKNGTATVDAITGSVSYWTGGGSTGGLSDSFGVVATDGVLNSQTAIVTVNGSAGKGSNKAAAGGGGSFDYFELLMLIIAMTGKAVKVRSNQHELETDRNNAMLFSGSVKSR